MSQKQSDELIRVSLGTAISLELIKAKQLVPPTNAYLMSALGCIGSCKFCSQSRINRKKDKLSRITWPIFSVDKVITSLTEKYEEGKFKRVCLQVTNHTNSFDEILKIFTKISELIDIPLSVSAQPFSNLQYQKLYDIGVRNVSISLDAANPQIFDEIKGKLAGGPYRWNLHWQAFFDAVSVFGKNNVTSHLIIGLGETDEEIIEIISKLFDLGIITALFSFTPLVNTEMSEIKSPKISRYRRIQLARHLITYYGAKINSFTFNNKGSLETFKINNVELDTIISSGEPFKTTGCPDCNRPFYNERVRGPWYNFPRLPNEIEVEQIKKELYFDE